MSHLSVDGYSATVSLELHVDNEIIPVSKIGPNRIMLKEARAVPDGAASLVVTIGATTKRTSVVLNGSNGADGTVLYR